jgi:hypothetical protein
MRDRRLCVSSCRRAGGYSQAGCASLIDYSRSTVANVETFVAWFGVMTVHVLAYAWRLPRILLGTPASEARQAVPAEPARWLLVTASLACGLLIAVLTVHLAAAWSQR